VNDNHDPKNGQFSTGGGPAGSGADHKKIRETVGSAMEEREGDRSNSAYLRSRAVKRQESQDRLKAQTKVAQSDQRNTDQWKADKQRAKDFMSGKMSAKDYTKR